MSTFYWGTTSSTTWHTNVVSKSKKDELAPLKKLVKEYSSAKDKEEKIEPVLFDPKDLVI